MRRDGPALAMMAPSTLLPCTIRVAVSAGATLRCRWASRLPTVALGAVRRFGLASCAAEPRRVCVVGSGPAGMYATSALLNASPDVQVDVIERLCTPFGLIRFGVAPDHPEMKVMADKFDVVAADERVRLIGNVEVGRDVSVAQLQRFYDGLIFAFGADGDRTIGLDGEHETDGVHAARDFVAWYNGLPSHRDLDFKLDEVDSVVVVGNGNVATDVARILLMPTTMLARTDIAAHALDALERSTVNKVTIVGRRGPAQAAWTGKELREILNTLPDVVVDIRSDELAMTESPADKAEMKAARVKKRCVGMLKKKLEEAAESHAADADSADATKVLSLRFCLSPAELHTIDHQVESSRLSGVSFTQMSLQGEAGKQRAVTVEGAELEQMDAQLLLRSVGYRSVEMDGLPWNDSWCDAICIDWSDCVVRCGVQQGAFLLCPLLLSSAAAVLSDLPVRCPLFLIAQHGMYAQGCRSY